MPSLVTARSEFCVSGRTDEQLREAADTAGLALRVDELRGIAHNLGRDPSLVEIHAFNAQWSEHCSYKSSRRLLRELPTTGPTVMQGPAEDAGILHLGEWDGTRYGIVIGHESHNHPSQVVPFEGAATGVGGIVRDVLCMGATVVAIADPLRFGRIENAHSHQRYVARSVVDGIAAYGNAIGIPNIAGDVYFDEGFADNCLVNVVALGLLKEEDIIHSAAPSGSAGWDIVLVGKAADASGFGGAAFSSLALDAVDEDANKGAVQVPDPFLKNVIMRASYRVFEMLREERVTAGFKDLGAGGIMGCTAELCAAGGYGAIIDLDDVSTSQTDLAAAVIALGETQERLAWIVPPHITPRVLEIYNREFSLPEIARGARAAVIGIVQDEKRYVLRRGPDVVMDVPIDFLTGAIAEEHVAQTGSSQNGAQSDVPRDIDVVAYLPRVLGHRDVCSREPLYRQYDGVVRGTTVIPRGFADAGVIAPIPGSPLGIALSVDGNPRYSKLSPKVAAELAVCEANRNVIAVGARPLGLTDCLNFGNPQKPSHYSELRSAIEGLAYAARRLETPYVSGNVSLYNEAKDGSAIPASPIVACVGGISDISKTASLSLKCAGSRLYLFGRRQAALGASVVAELAGLEGCLPFADYEGLQAEREFILRAYQDDMILAAHDISDGGLLTALAEMAFGDGSFACGARIGCWDDWAPEVGAAAAYFGETGGFLVEVDSARDEDFRAPAVPSALFRKCIGETVQEPVLCVGAARFELDALYEAWSTPLVEAYP
ncbi:MAG: phosphoribosylformylglycinamidine synthase subunit PurL [Candidatus Eremiobacteraeota bacterium]|nr:phosphoribosylformylglycinamidine synthase subunit PurL [Candidatus Eremiobacteraeota bacterium]